MGDRKKAEARTREGRGKEQQQQGLDIELPKARFCLRQANSCLLRGRSSCVHFFFLNVPHPLILLAAYIIECS